MRVTCPTCGGPHPKWECVSKQPKTEPIKVSEVVGSKLITHDAVRVKRGRPKMTGPTAGKSKRAEYQRELMRKLREMRPGAA